MIEIKVQNKNGSARVSYDGKKSITTGGGSLGLECIYGESEKLVTQSEPGFVEFEFHNGRDQLVLGNNTFLLKTAKIDEDGVYETVEFGEESELGTVRLNDDEMFSNDRDPQMGYVQGIQSVNGLELLRMQRSGDVSQVDYVSKKRGVKMGYVTQMSTQGVIAEKVELGINDDVISAMGGLSDRPYELSGETETQIKGDLRSYSRPDDMGQTVPLVPCFLPEGTTWQTQGMVNLRNLSLSEGILSNGYVVRSVDIRDEKSGVRLEMARDKWANVYGRLISVEGVELSHADATITDGSFWRVDRNARVSELVWFPLDLRTMVAERQIEISDEEKRIVADMNANLVSFESRGNQVKINPHKSDGVSYSLSKQEKKIEAQGLHDAARKGLDDRVEIASEIDVPELRIQVELERVTADININASLECQGVLTHRGEDISQILAFEWGKEGLDGELTQTDIPTVGRRLMESETFGQVVRGLYQGNLGVKKAQIAVK